MKLETIEVVRRQVRSASPKAIIEIIASHMDKCEDARNRIESEGIVVRDMKGSVIAHPAIKIEIEAGKVVSDLIGKYKKAAVKQGQY